MSQTININYYDVVEVVDVTVVDEVITINVNIVQSSGAVTSVNGATGTVVLDADDISDTSTTHKFTTAEELTKLAGIAAGAEVNVNADWNATSGDAEILNKPTIPSLTGVELTANKQNSLAVDGTGAKYPTVDAVNSGLSGVNTNSTRKDTVKLTQAINKGQAVYVSGADGTNILASKASNTTEALSSKTVGLLETTGTTNAIVNVVTDGLLAGLNTSSATIGDPVWLGVNGDLIFGLANKPYAPAHLVYIGLVTRVNANNGEILIKVQNGFELKEIHDVDLITSTPTNKQLLSYDSATSIWKNKSVTTDDIAESGSPTNRWWTNARTIAATLTGYVSGAGVVAATDTILQAIQKLNGNIAALVTGVSSVNSKTGAVTLVASDISGASQNLINDGALSENRTGVTTEQPFTTVYTIPAGAIGSNVCATLMSRFVKSGTAGSMRIKMYVNTVASSTSGSPQLIADYTLSATNIWMPLDRLLTFTGSNLIVSNVANTAATDTTNNTNAFTSVTLNTANTWYLITTCTLGNAADIVNRRATILRF